MVRRRNPPSQTWRTFLENHLKSTVSIDFFTVPTIRFRVLYVFLVLTHDRRRIIHYFGGLSLEETAEILGVSIETAKPDRKMARAWLYTRLTDKQKPPKS